MVTHDPHAAAYADRVVFLADGEFVDELLDPDAPAILERMMTFEQAAGAHGSVVSEPVSIEYPPGNPHPGGDGAVTGGRTGLRGRAGLSTCSRQPGAR